MNFHAYLLLVILAPVFLPGIGGGGFLPPIGGGGGVFVFNYVVSYFDGSFSS